MPAQRLRVLVLSEFFPNPVRPAFGIFIERQVFYLQPYCDNVVVVPTRIFPNLRLWKHILNPRRFIAAWRAWRAELRSIPLVGDVNGICVSYPRYTSPPKQVFHGVWGFFAYLFIRRRLRAMHDDRVFDLIHAHYASPSGVIALLTRRWMKVPVVLSVHGADVTYTVKQNPLSAIIIRWVFRHADTILANSSWTRQQIIQYGAEPDRVKIVRLGGNPDEHCDSLQRIQRDDRLTLLSVCYLEERKGCAYMLRAVRQLLDQGYSVRYVVVGDGSSAERLRALIDELGLAGSVSFEGYQPHDKVWSYFAGCDIFTLPSWDEAFGVVYIEALSMGKPVVGCKGEGGPEDLRALGDCIELVRPRDVDSLVQALKRLLDDPDRRRRMGEIGRRIVAEHFTWQRNAADTRLVYHDVIRSRSRSDLVATKQR